MASATLGSRRPRRHPAPVRRNPVNAIGAASTPSEAAAPAPPGQRSTILERCNALGVRLTDKRRKVIAIFDAAGGPIDMETVWWRCQEQGFDINRSSIHRLASELVKTGVLTTMGWHNRRARYGAALDIAVEVRSPHGPQVVTLDDPAIIEALVAAALARGLDLRGRKLTVAADD